MTLASHRLLLDLMALEAEFCRVIMLNSEPPLIPETQKVSQDLVSAHGLVGGCEAAKIAWLPDARIHDGMI
jgi:hypothetical protein